MAAGISELSVAFSAEVFRVHLSASTVIFKPQSSQEGSPGFQRNICSIRQPLMTHPHEKVYLCSDVILQWKTNRTGVFHWKRRSAFSGLCSLAGITIKLGEV